MTTTDVSQLLAEVRLFRADVDARFDKMAEQIGELKVAEAERRGRESTTNPGIVQEAPEGSLAKAMAKWLDRWTPLNVILLVFAVAVLVGTMTIDDFRSISPWPPPPAAAEKVDDNASDDAAWVDDDTAGDPWGPRPLP